MPARSPELTAKLRDLEQRCRAAGLALTVQRRVILEAVANREDHPTAEQIYDVVRARIPEISRATVYRALDSIVQLGLVQRTHHHGPAARFDPKVGHHHHLVCVRCNRLVDYEDPQLDRLPLPDEAVTGFRTTGYSVHFAGLCAACSTGEPTLEG